MKRRLPFKRATGSPLRLFCSGANGRISKGDFLAKTLIPFGLPMAQSEISNKIKEY